MRRSYSFSDLVRFSGATPNNLKNWVQKGVIVPDLGDTSGTGEHREFAFRDVFEAAVAHRLNQIPGGIPTRELTLAVDAIRSEIPSSDAERARRRALVQEHLESLKPEDAGDAWLLGFCLSLGPSADYQRWREFIDPTTRDPRANFWLVWDPRLGFGVLIDNNETLQSLLADIDALVIVNVRSVLLEVEKATGDHWVVEAGAETNPAFEVMGLPGR